MIMQLIHALLIFMSIVVCILGVIIGLEKKNVYLFMCSPIFGLLIFISSFVMMQ